MHYRKGENVEEELTVEKVPINNLPKDFLWMKVSWLFFFSYDHLGRSRKEMGFSASNPLFIWFARALKIAINSHFLLQVNGGTKLTNVVDYAVKSVKSGEYRSVLWTGSGGGGISKTVSCAEIMKREFEMHQITRIKYRL